MLESLTNAEQGAVGVTTFGAAFYAMVRMFKKDRRDDRAGDTADSAMTQVIQTLREEIARLSERLEKVEQENQSCQENNLKMQAKIMALEASMSPVAA